MVKGLAGYGWKQFKWDLRLAGVALLRVSCAALALLPLAAMLALTLACLRYIGVI